MSFSTRLREARKRKGLSQAELGNAAGITKSTVSGYESGKSAPDHAKLLAIMGALNIDANYLYQDDMAAQADRHPWHEPLTRAYALASEPTQKNICKLLDIPHVLPNTYSKRDQANAGRRRPAAAEGTVSIRRYTDPAAAGFPDAAAGSDYTVLELPEAEVPAGASFAVGIRGASMEPMIKNGETVWVDERTGLADGDIAILMVGPEAFCKRVRLNAEGRIVRLESENPLYFPIVGASLLDAKVIGKVILKL